MKRAEILYCYDALCGWCFGFSPVVAQLHAEFGKQIPFRVFSGGLFTGERVGPINAVAPYIKGGAYLTVEEHCGVKFGAAFLDDLNGNGRLTMDSLPPAIALSIVKDQAPGRALEFAGVLTNAIYGDGMDPVDLDAYSAYVDRAQIAKAATGLALTGDAFRQRMGEPRYAESAKVDFLISSRIAGGGYPALLLRMVGPEHEVPGGDAAPTVPLSQGYSNLDDVRNRLKTLLAKHAG